MSDYVWGNSETKFFFELGPESVLTAVERNGYATTGRCLTLNSMENRVYDVELLLEETPKIPADRFRVAKFYRPGRWTLDQIREEHEFLLSLADHDIPVIAPESDHSGETIHLDPETGIYFAIFPKRGGRAPDELSHEQLAWLGRTIARIHQVGEAKPANHRITMNYESYGYSNLDFLLNEQKIPLELEKPYASIVETIGEKAADWFSEAESIRLHGDCHLGNILWRDSGPLFLDFDDMVMGPPVQDLWLLMSERSGPRAEAEWDLLIENYSTFRTFDYGSRRLIEVLRAMRFIHFSAWIGKRWQDPAFQQAFPYYGTHQYWSEQLRDLEEQWDWIQRI